MALTSLWGTANAGLLDPIISGNYVSKWGIVNGTLLEPLSYINSAWGAINSTLSDPYKTGAIPSVYNQTSQTWVTVQPVRWDTLTNQWISQ